jgi:hypothetical protein
MISRQLIFLIIFIPFLAFGQISVKTNLPPEIKTNSEISFEARIWKGPLKNFSKYQMELPKGVTISEIDCKTGSFSLEDNVVKIIWAITPPENEFTINLKLSSADVKGERTIVHKYYYLEKGEKREIEMAPIRINFVDVLSEPSTASDPPASQPALTDTIRAASLLSQDELRQQVVMLKKDSKEAYEVGEREKAIAEKKLNDADEAVKKAKAVTNPKERSSALQKAMTAKDKAESDLAVANRILTLAKSLEEDAEEIEKLNLSLDSIGVNDQRTNTLVKEEMNGAAGNEKDVKPAINTPGVEKTKQNALNKGAKDAKGLYKPVAVNDGDVRKAIQQVGQLKRDSKEANEVGSREKKKAEQKLTEAYEALKRAEYITDEEEKKLAIEKATHDKQKAEKDLEIASKILTLAKSLEDNAREIEHLNGDAPAAPATSVATRNQPAGKPVTNEETTPAKEDKATAARKDAEKLPDLFKEEKKAPKPVTKTETMPVENGLVFKLQIGAFAKDPDRTQFNSIGVSNVKIIKEGAMFKALYGSFQSREDAVTRRDQLRSKGFDGFVVMFKDGVKVK